MGGLRFQQFTGEKPGRHPQKLELSDAEEARNVRLLSGALEAWRGSAKAYDSSLTNLTRTLFRTQYGRWVEWPVWYRVVNTINPNDPYDRIFLAGGDRPPQVLDPDRAGTDEDPSYPLGSLRLGVPGPESPLANARAISHSSAIDWADSNGLSYPSDWPVEIDDEEGTPRTRTYTYTVTLENNFGEESIPAIPTAPVDVGENETVKFALPAVPEMADAGDVILKRYFIYRSTGGPFQYIGSAPIEWGEYVDLIPDGAAAEVLESEDNDMPPEDMDGIVTIGGNFYAGFVNNEVVFSQPGLPHAWPTAYRQPVDYRIVELASFGQTLVVMTQGSLFLGHGGHPAGLTLQNTAIQQPCVSRESVVTLAGGVMYASPDGLVYVTGQGPQIVTQDIFDRDTWQKLNPETIRAAQWYHLYVGWYDGEDGPGGFVFDPNRPSWGVIFFDTPYPTAVYSLVEEDRLFYAYDGEIREWDAGERMTYRWRSRPIDLSAPAALSVVRVSADDYPVTFRLFRDGELQYEGSAENANPKRISGATLGRTYQLEVESSAPVYEFAFGTTVQETKHA